MPKQQPIQITSSAILRAHHPDVKLIPKLSDKSVEERILRTADRMKSFPAAVDTLHKALTAVQNDPDSDKFRRIDTTSAGYQRSVAPATGAADFLATMGFQQQHQQQKHYLVLHRPLYDPALIYLGISALQQTRLTPEYVTAKQELVFVKEVQAMMLNNNNNKNLSAEEKQKRAAWRQQCPKEPAPGRGALMQIEFLGSGSGISLVATDDPPPTTTTTTTTLRRRFDGDDTLQDVVHWLGATMGKTLLERLESGAWCLTDLNRAGAGAVPVPLDLTRLGHHTLQYIGCWPSGRLQVRPTATTTMDADSATTLLGGESRGLASGASSDTD